MKEHAARRIFVNIAAIAGGNMTSRICGLVLVVVLARYLGPEKYGIYALSLAFYAVFLLLANWGLDTLAIRELAGERQHAGAMLSQVTGLKIILAVVSLLILFVTVPLMGYQESTTVCIVLMSVAIFPACCVDSLKSLATAFERMECTSVIEVFRSLLSLLLVLAVVIFRGNVVQVISLQLLSISLSLFFGLWILHRYVYTLKNLRLSLSEWRPLLFRAAPFFLITAIAILNNRIDLILLSYFREETAVGTYSAALTLVDILYVGPALVCQALFPTMTRLAQSDDKQLVTVGNTAFKFLITLAVPIGVGLFILADQLIVLIYGMQFLPSSILLKFFAASVVVEFALDLIFWLFIVYNRENYVLRTNIAFTCINVFFNLLLIPRFGLLGAAVTNVICSMFIAGTALVLKKKYLPDFTYFSHYGKPLAAVCTMAPVAWLLAGHLFIALVIPLAATVYLATLYIIGGIDKEEIIFLFRCLKADGNEET